MIKMINAASEKNCSPDISLIFRAARKEAGFSQIDIARKLGISQGTLSKLENGVLTPSAPLWFEFCKLTKIPSDSLTEGYIDHGVALGSLPKDSSIGLFKIPPRFLQDRGTSVRSLMPFVIEAKRALGTKRLQHFAHSLGADLDYFCNLDHKISFAFMLELWKALENRKILKIHNTNDFAAHSRDICVHGYRSYARALDYPSLDGLIELLKNSKIYDTNFLYKTADRTKASVTILIRSEEHMSRYRSHLSEGWGAFLCDYKKNYFKHFLQNQSSSRVEVIEHECMFDRSGEQCVYEYRVQ